MRRETKLMHESCIVGSCGSRTIPPGQSPRTIPTYENYPRTIAPGQFPPRTIAPLTIPPDNSHVGLLYCPRIITPRRLLPRAMTTTNYNFLMAIFRFFSMAQLYNFCYDNKNNIDNSNKTWNLK